MVLEQNKIKKILIIKTHRLGDVLVTTPMIKATSQMFPRTQVDVLVYRDCYELVEGLSFIDKIWSIKRRDSFINNWKLWVNLLKEKYDLLFNLTFRTKADFYALSLGARFRVGYGSTFSKKNFIYTHLVGMPKTFRHEVEQNLDALRRIGYFPKSDISLQYSIAKSAHAKIKKIFTKNKIIPKQYVHLHPASRWLFKCPPAYLVSKIVENLINQGKKIVITCAPNDNEIKYTQEIIDSSPNIKSEIKAKNIINLSGKTNIDQLALIAKNAELYLGVDTLAMHLAAAMGTKIAVFFGPSGEKHWHPWQTPHIILSDNNFTCRPCGLAGCGNSGKSECLSKFNPEIISYKILEFINSSIDENSYLV